MEYSLLIVFLFLAALFSGTELAFLSINRIKLEVDLKKGAYPTNILKKINQDPSRFIAGMWLGKYLSLIVFGFLLSRLSLDYFETNFGTHGELRFLLLQTIFLSILFLIFGEFLPRILARINSGRWFSVFAVPMYILFSLLSPWIKFSGHLSNLLIPRFIRTTTREWNGSQGFGKMDINKWMGDSKPRENSEIEVDSEIRIFQNALDFSAIKVRDCMIPRTEIVAVEINESIDKLTQLFIQTGLSRILVYRDNIDSIIAYFKYSELFNRPQSIQSKMVELPIIPESMAAPVLLEKFTKEKKNIAVVVDEFGGTAGVVTLEDIMEKIFGDIEDEHDYIQLTETKVNEKEFILSGRLEVDYLNETFHLDLPEQEEFNTLAGYILHHSPNIPSVGEIVLTDRYEIKILEVSETRIELVNLKVK